MEGQQRPSRPPLARRRSVVNAFTADERAKVLKALGTDDYHFGTRAGYLMRTCPFLKYSPRATALYLLLSGFFGADKKLPPDTVRVPMRVIARWLHCTSRTAQRAVQELTRSGPLPLILEKPGRPGQVSEYTFVRDPFKVAAMQEVEAVRNKAKRGAAIVAAQADIHAAESRGDITAACADAKLKATVLRRAWNTPTRGAVVVGLDAQAAAPSPEPDVQVEKGVDIMVTASTVTEAVEANEAAKAETPQHITDLRSLKERLGLIADPKQF